MNPSDPVPPGGSQIAEGWKKPKVSKLSFDQATMLASKHTSPSPMQIKCCHSGPCKRVTLDCCKFRNACFKRVVESVQTGRACPFCHCKF